MISISLFFRFHDGQPTTVPVEEEEEEKEREEEEKEKEEREELMTTSPLNTSGSSGYELLDLSSEKTDPDKEGSIADELTSTVEELCSMTERVARYSSN